MEYLDSVSLLSLGSTCQRLKGVSADPSLWKVVDLSAASSSVSQCRQRLAHINEKTKSITIKGFFHATSDLSLKPPSSLETRKPDLVGVWHREFKAFKDHDLQRPPAAENTATSDSKKETLSPALMKMIAKKCPHLEELNVLCCNVNANTMDFVDVLPNSLTSLSIVHCNFTNLCPQKSPFFKIHLAVPKLQRLDVSWNPQWVTNHSLGSVCKCEDIRHLNLRGCRRIGELFAYTALATRFGFRQLERLDLRDTSVGNSEVPCFASLPNLTHLYFGHTTAHCTRYEPPRGSESDGQITDRALYYFVNEDWSSGHTKLRCLDLWNCRVTQKMILALLKRKHIRWINFSGTGEQNSEFGPLRTLIDMQEVLA